MAGEIDSDLRQELIECQKARSEFIRWKLILVAVLGSSSLGLSKDAPALPYLMALIPFVCIYVDSVCMHNDSRIMMIAQFLRTSNEVSAAARDYEQFCHKHRHMFYNEGLALFGSSLFLSVAVVVFALWRSIRSAMSPRVAVLVALSGVIGMAVTLRLLSVNRQIQGGEAPSRLLSAPSDPPAPPEQPAQS